MKAITVCEPYASAIIKGPKRCENRGNNWRFRGRLLIHAGKSRKYMGTMTAEQLKEWRSYDESALTFGAILGSIEVFNCVLFDDDMLDDPWAFGPFCLLLRDPIVFPKPIPYRGEQGLFNVPDEVLRGEPVPPDPQSVMFG